MSCLWFINEDSADCRLENIELIIRGENEADKNIWIIEEILKAEKLINKLNKNKRWK